jgi:hypothetical protein
MGVLEAFARLTDKHDLAIHTAAGLRWPPNDRVARAVKFWDLTLFVTEWRDLMGGVEHPDWERYRNIEPLPERIVPMPQEAVTHELLNRCQSLLPAFSEMPA